MKVTLKLLLAVAVVLLAYMCYQSIMTPIKFDKEKEIRDDAIIARLIEIRKAQIEYKNVKGDPFDWLYIDFGTLSLYASQYGFRAEKVQSGEHYDYLARLTLR